MLKTVYIARLVALKVIKAILIGLFQMEEKAQNIILCDKK